MDQHEITHEVSKAFFEAVLLKGDLLQLLTAKLKETVYQSDKEDLVAAIQSVSKAMAEDCGVYLELN